MSFTYGTWGKYSCEAVDTYISLTGNSDCSGFEEAYQGEWDSEEAFRFAHFRLLSAECKRGLLSALVCTKIAEQLADDCGYLSQIPESLRYYFDFSAFARDLFMDGYSFENGHVFYDR